MKAAPSIFGVDDEGVQQKKHQNIWLLQYKAQLHDMKPSLCSAHLISFEPHKAFVISVMARIWTGQSMVCLLAHPTSYSMGTVGSFPRNKVALGQSCAKVKNKWSYTSANPTYFQFFIFSLHHTTLTLKNSVSYV
jgi:hypothetical protein